MPWRGASVLIPMDGEGTNMDARVGITLIAVAAAGMAGCATSNPLARWGLTSPQVEPTAKMRATCEDSVRTLQGRPDYDTALHACLQAAARRGKS